MCYELNDLNETHEKTIIRLTTMYLFEKTWTDKNSMIETMLTNLPDQLYYSQANSCMW